jgi:ketosteroid isomerase-like protein
VAVVRKPLRIRGHSSRTLDQRISIRFPWLAAASFRVIARLPPTSRLRQAALWRAMRLTMEAYNRGDLAAVAVGFHRDLEYRPYREFAEAGLTESCYRGPSGYIDYITATYEVWSDGVKLYPTELIDLGDRLVLLADMPMQAQASGVALSEKYASVMTIRDGSVVHVQDYLNQAEALETVGLSS